MKWLQSFVIAIAMYSKIPVPQVEWKEDNMKYAIGFFPVVGMVIGILVWLIGTAILKSNATALFFAGAMTLLPILISGGIHLDGFMDTMDALGSYGDREKKLEILKDTHCGAFAILGLGGYLVWSLAVWSNVTAEMLPVIACGYVISRSLSGSSVVWFPSARKKGLARTFHDGAERKTAGIILLLTFVSACVGMLWVNWLLGMVGIVCALLTFWYYYHICMWQFGGMTGDLAGFFLQLCELAQLTGIMIAGGGIWK